MAFNCKVPSYYYVQAMNESILTRNACIAEPHKAQWGAGEGPQKVRDGRRERIGVNCVTWEGGFQHWL